MSSSLPEGFKGPENSRSKWAKKQGGRQLTFLGEDRLGEVAFTNRVSIVAGVLNRITVNGLSRGGGAYGGQLSFIPSAVPEPGTWAMMLVGFGMMGASMRYRRRSTKTVYA
jgi:hypothetical protein